MCDSLPHKKSPGSLEEQLPFLREVAAIFVEHSWRVLCCSLSLYLQTEAVGSFTGWLCTDQPHQPCQGLQDLVWGATTCLLQPWADSTVFPFLSVKNLLPCLDRNDPASAPANYSWAKLHRVHRLSAEDMTVGASSSGLAQGIVLRYWQSPEGQRDLPSDIVDVKWQP